MALLLYLLSYVSILFHICFVTISFAAGLYYISEIVEEYTERAKKVVKFLTFATIVLYLLLLVGETFTWTLIVCGLLAQLVHLAILRNFPNIKILSLEFGGAVFLLLFNHYLAYKHFQEVYYSLSEILGYFTLCLWVVPFALFVSLSANDQVLPSYQEIPNRDNDNDVVTNYFSSRKRQNLLNFFKSAKSSILPTRSKKSF